MRQRASSRANGRSCWRRSGRNAVEDSESQLLNIIQALNRWVWRQQVGTPLIEDWLRCFGSDCVPGSPGRLQALYLLSRFMYFGDEEVRALLRALYRDNFKYPIVASIRRTMGNTRNVDELNTAYKSELSKSRFLAIGNPAESGAHLLYHFRQENELDSRLFISTHELFDLTAKEPILALPAVSRYIFIDDFCGSGSQGVRYSKALLARIRSAAEQAGVSPTIGYHVLLGTTKGLERVKTEANFDEIACVMRLDESFRAFGDDSRYFRRPPPGVDRESAKHLAEIHGQRLAPAAPLGFDDGQLLLGFVHNTPNNTLPLFWHGGDATTPWQPLFRRYYKLVGQSATGW